jgi:hypothetical protein
MQSTKLQISERVCVVGLLLSKEAKDHLGGRIVNHLLSQKKSLTFILQILKLW